MLGPGSAEKALEFIVGLVSSYRGLEKVSVIARRLAHHRSMRGLFDRLHVATRRSNALSTVN